ncbi:uncharacterized protein LOC104895218 [Beta vulgaris subsp. vulgaris]|uniref:uncharacterized protein LOC104895218 n=1 Tax=Beta vulgaris subsp. vulgaris TaxID=3555 RepID=UPI0020374C28|nr:uncharacterized protein LOC104895218 [Beta vulgaris subsp. vulgaris]
MAEDLDDGEFWLPSHFLTDDDILMDFDFQPSKHIQTSDSNSDLDFTSGSTETESDEEDILLTGLTRQLTLQDSSCPVHSKGTVLSSSPQSTLFGCLCQQSSSRESQSGPISPPQPQPQDKENNNNNNKNDTLDLLNKAAGEVARLKLKTEKSSGTGFFDCSQKGVLYPSPITNIDTFPPLFYQPQFHHFSHMVWAPQYNQPPKQQPQNRATNNNNNNKSNNNKSSTTRPLGLPPSAWPPLQAQVQAQTQAQVQAQAQNQAPVMAPGPIFVGPKRECVGTGVFLPRRVTTPTEARKKSDGNSTKTKNGKGSQLQSNHRRNSRTTSTVNPNEIQLPQEWTY